MVGSELFVRRRGLVAVVWLGVVCALLPATRGVERTLDVSARVEGSESGAVEKELATAFGSPFSYQAVLVLGGVPPIDSEAGRAVLGRVVASVEAEPGVTRTLSYLDTGDTLFAGHGGGTFVIVGLDPGDAPVDALIPGLRAAAQRVLPALRDEHPSATLRWTGEAALNFDLRRTSTTEANAAERRALPITLLLLLIAFGAIAAALLPVLSGALAISLALGAAALLGTVWSLSILLVSVVTMIGLGLGIDYALLAVSRFREALAGGATAEVAAMETARRAGDTIRTSGIAVAIGFAALLLVPLNELRSVAVGGLLVVAASVLLATTLLPGVLAWMGHRIDAFAIRRPDRRHRKHRRWRRWGGFVAAHPLLVLGLSVPPLALLAVPASRLRTELPRGDWLPPSMESARGLVDLREMRRSGIVQGLRVVLDLPEGKGALSAEGWAATDSLTRTLARDPRIRQVRSLPMLSSGLGMASAPHGSSTPVAPPTFVRRDGRATLLEVVLGEDVQPGAASRLVRELRSSDAAASTGLPGTRIRVGGLPAFNVDYEDAIAGWFTYVLALVIGGTLLALMWSFRSILVPLKAVALNLLSVAAAFGALVLTFQDGHGAALLGLDGPTGGVFPAVPILVFCTVFGLSMDYEVFLVARVREARRAGADDAAAIAEGLATTGGVITSAASIMIAVFAAFMFGGFLLTKMLGFTLAVAVLLDAAVIRVAVGPALLRLAGRWNWWPGEG